MDAWSTFGALLASRDALRDAGPILYGLVFDFGSPSGPQAEPKGAQGAQKRSKLCPEGAKGGLESMLFII